MADLNEGVRPDGTVADCDVETYCLPLDYATQADGYLRVVADDGPTNAEVRVPNEALVALGWTPPGAMPRSDSAEAAAAIEAVMQQRSYPASPAAAARAGYEAAYRAAGVKVDAVPLPLADAQMLLSWMDETFGNEGGDDWMDEDAAAVGDALEKAVENFKRMRAACGVAVPGDQTKPPHTPTT